MYLNPVGYNTGHQHLDLLIQFRIPQVQDSVSGLPCCPILTNDKPQVISLIILISQLYIRVSHLVIFHHFAKIAHKIQENTYVYQVNIKNTSWSVAVEHAHPPELCHPLETPGVIIQKLSKSYPFPSSAQICQYLLPTLAILSSLFVILCYLTSLWKLKYWSSRFYLFVCFSVSVASFLKNSLVVITWRFTNIDIQAAPFL